MESGNLQGWNAPILNGKAVDSVKSICASFKFKVINKPILVKGAPDAKAKLALAKLGKALAETIK